MPLQNCCGRVDAAAGLPRRGFDLPLDDAGGPIAEGHDRDIYWIGAERRRLGQAPPSQLQWRPLTAASLDVDLATLYPSVRQVRFVRLGDVAHDDNAAAVDDFLHARYGVDAQLRRLGRGGHQVAVLVCKVGAPCFVAKLRRLAPLPPAVEAARTPADHVAALQTQADDSAEGLRRDLAMLQAADVVSRHALWLGGDGRPVALRVAGQEIRPAASAVGEPGQLIRGARLQRPAALGEGIIEMELVDWRPSAGLSALLAGNMGANGTTRDAIWTQAPAAGVERVRAMAFADRYNRGSDLGPELYKLRTFVDDCRELSAVPKIAEICTLAQHDFALVDDMAERIRAVEQVYRLSSPLVLRLARQQIGRTVLNDGPGGRLIEVGLDLNHGRNVGWDPQTCQFVIFDS